GGLDRGGSCRRLRSRANSRNNSRCCNGRRRNCVRLLTDSNPPESPAPWREVAAKGASIVDLRAADLIAPELDLHLVWAIRKPDFALDTKIGCRVLVVLPPGVRVVQ